VLYQITTVFSTAIIYRYDPANFWPNPFDDIQYMGGHPITRDHYRDTWRRKSIH